MIDPKLERFATTLGGTAVVCYMDYQPAEGDGVNSKRYEATAYPEYVLIDLGSGDGPDIWSLMDADLLEKIGQKYLKERKDLIESNKAENAG
jgi:hypothetical protein